MVSSRPLLLAVVALAVVAPACALQCWMCSSNQDPRCRDPFNSTRLPQNDCDRTRPVGNFAYCQKIVTSINGGEQKIVRRCLYSQDVLHGNCPDQPSNDFITVDFCSTCSENLCNGSPGTTSKTTAAVAAALGLMVSWIGTRFI